jgi:hypothetical protein
LHPGAPRFTTAKNFRCEPTDRVTARGKPKAALPRPTASRGWRPSDGPGGSGQLPRGWRPAGGELFDRSRLCRRALPATVTLADQAAGVAVNPATNTIYAAVDQTVAVINGQDNTVTTTTDGTVYTAFNIIGEGGDVNYMGIVASCASGTAISAGTGCAKLAAGFHPSAMSFGSPAHGVIAGALGCSLPNMPVMMTTATAIDSAVHLAGHHQEGLFTRPVGGAAWSRVAGIGRAFTGLAGSGHAAWLIIRRRPHRSRRLRPARADLPISQPGQVLDGDIAALQHGHPQLRGLHQPHHRLDHGRGPEFPVAHHRRRPDLAQGHP